MKTARAVWTVLIPAALGLEAMWLKLAVGSPSRENLVPAIHIYLLSSTVYTICAYLAYKSPATRKGETYRWAAVILVALAFRLTVWPMMPLFTDDPVRYRWEGRVQEAGGNPYQSAPADAAWAHLRDETWLNQVTPDARAGYGPLIEMVQWGWYRTLANWTEDAWRQVFWFKAPGAAADLGVIAALAWLLRLRNLPAERLLLYAWSPLTVVEFWGNGHNDPIALVFVVVAVCLAVKLRWKWAFLALGGGIAAKLWPGLLVPIFTGWKGWRPARWWQWTLSVVPFVVCFAPYWSDVMRNARYMTGFVGDWRNNDSIYGLLLAVTGDRYDAKYSAFALAGLWVAYVTVRRWPVEKACLAAIAGLLLVSANCHPWYLTWMLPFLAVTPAIPVLLWAALMPIAYAPLIEYYVSGVWDGVSPLRWLIYGPVFASIVWEAIKSWHPRTSR